MKGLGREMKKIQPILLALFVVFTLSAQCGDTVPLKLVTTYKFPSDVKGRFDHLIVDLPGQRLFTTAMQHKSVEVFDLRTGELIHSISGVERPHALFYRQDLQRLYVTDGEGGDLKIFDGKTYKLTKTIRLLVGADGIAYDPATKYLYVVNGGASAKMTHSIVSVIDTTDDKKLNEMKIDSDTLETLQLERSSPRMYLNDRGKNQIDVIDRNTLQVVAIWPVTLGKGNDPFALDEPHHRLFVACRSGQIIVFDTQTGKELQALQIGQWADDLAFDPTRKRLYAACGESGTVDVYEQINPDHYQSLGKVVSGPWGKTGRLVPELNRYFVPVPQHEDKDAEVLVYEVQ
jgi:DNA-binding beta-propeller fold protein YncE